MKLVFSRKGFDSSAGGVASPILPDGRLISLPIPDAHAPLRYRDLGRASAGVVGNELATPSIATLVDHLAPRLSRRDRAHLDPDLDAGLSTRLPGWRPAFGQAASALGHLQKHSVGVGDLFVFFGWFRQVERHRRRWRYVPGSPDQHVIFGWLQVGKVVDLLQAQPAEPWLSHVHCQRTFRGGNSLYIASECLALDGVDQPLSGGGHWPQIAKSRVLTAPGRSRSHWRLPRAFAPRAVLNGTDCLSYHTSEKRWRVAEDHCELHVTPRGQEFVLNCDERPSVGDWLRQLFASG